jgi:hypothetical protein
VRQSVEGGELADVRSSPTSNLQPSSAPGVWHKGLQLFGALRKDAGLI